MKYADRRNWIRERRKISLLATLQKAAESGEVLSLTQIADRTACPVTTLRVLRQELIAAGLIDADALQTPQNTVPHDLENRIAVVREAKHRKWLRTGRLGLAGRELKRALAHLDSSRSEG